MYLIADISDYKFSTLEKIAIIFYILAEINADLFAYRAIFIASITLLVFTFFLKGKCRIAITPYLSFFILWFLYVCLSYFYTESQSGTISSIITIAARTIVLTSFVYRLRSKELVAELLKLAIIASVVNTLYMLAMVDLASLGEERLGHSTLDEKWNANAIGLQLAFCTFFIFYLLQTKVYESGFFKLLSIISFVLFATVILLTGSRKSLFLLFFPPILFYMFYKADNKFIGRIILVSVLLFIAYQIIMSVEPLYNILGSRVENLLNNMCGNEVQDGSISSRRSLITMGMGWFYDRPWIGYGMNSFEELSGRATGMYWYAHNNYVELLVDVGIIGFIVYYRAYYHVLKLSLKKQFTDWQFGVSMLISILIAEYGLVSWKHFMTQFVIMLVFALININNKYEYNE